MLKLTTPEHQTVAERAEQIAEDYDVFAQQARLHGMSPMADICIEQAAKAREIAEQYWRVR